MLLGERLKMERERLAISQSVFAGMVGVSRNTQHKYEQDIRRADAVYLKRAAALGIDLFYVLTGNRGINLSEGTSAEVVEFMENAGRLSATYRSVLLHVGLAWVKTNE